MGLSLLTLLLVYLPSAICRAPATCTTTLLRSLVDPGGAFDIPNAKCPPDRGSSDCVTGSPASSISSSSSFSRYSSSPNTSNDSFTHPSYSPYPSAVPPRDIPIRANSPYDIATPPLTPDDDEDCYATGIITKHSKDALDLLLAIFPRDGLSLLPYAKSVVVAAPNMGASFDGVVLELPGRPKTLYVDGKNAQAVSLRESIVALLDLADEQLQCSALVIAFNKVSHGLSELLHSLMYVGGSVVTKPPFQVDPAYILVGVEI
ncbi:ornithine decarboxylase antizyme-domain-containing protein [Suillus occidentalis]|nr:ornithine decarboxylase antizyme-domain-containing protein [Suillus occidentalis]